MSDFLIRLAINAAAVFAAVQLVPGVEFGNLSRDWWKLLAVALILGAVNAYLRPIVRLLALPISLVTMGLVAFVINAALLLLVALVSNQLDLGFTLGGWPDRAFGVDAVVAALLASIVISVVSTLLGLVRTLAPGI